MPATPASGTPAVGDPGAYGDQNGPELTAGQPAYASAPYAEQPGTPYEQPATPYAEQPGTPYEQPGTPYAEQPATPYEQPGTPYTAQQSGPPYGRPPFDPAGAPYGYEAPTAPHERPAFGAAATGNGPRGGAAVAAFLAFLVVALGAPALVLAWRSAVGDHLVPSGLVGGLLAVTGLSVLAAGLFRLATKGDDGSGPLSERLLRAPALLVLVGTVLLVGAAIAV
jgi:hypothetical protein